MNNGYIIRGGKTLSGKIKVESAKNAVLPIMCACLLTEEQCVIESCPKITDVLNMVKILNKLGCKTKFEGENLIIDSSLAKNVALDNSLTKELRSSVFILGSMVSRFKKASVSYPGGCDIGLRPIDLHINAFRELGVIVSEDGGEINCVANKIVGNEIYLDFPSVGATENIMLLTAVSDGTTVIYNPAKEPEIKDLMNFLNKMGAKIVGAGRDKIVIEGVKKLHGISYKAIGDRIEAGTFLIGTAITGGEIEISGIKAENLAPLLNKLVNNTCNIRVKDDIIYLKSGLNRKGFFIDTRPHPGFPTDLQPQMLALACVSTGVSVIRENIFETRFKHVGELVKLGAEVTVKDRVAIVTGVERLKGGEVYAHDLRGGAALVLAGLNAYGKTMIHDVKHIERGYYAFEQKIKRLGGDIERF
ncbi:MAG: UDP-N-acetylglucosamine 1-carboxyvinyltransferase [Clostridia bacterium]|nr:UDP-N-acetylglucosamine 1-carboxyvinyltransferase [Clostridia bacterium]